MGVSSFNPRNLLQINSNEGFLGRTPHMNCMLWFRRLCFKAQTQLTVPGHPGPWGAQVGTQQGRKTGVRSLPPRLSPCSAREGLWALEPGVPVLTLGLPRTGTLPGTSNKPPRMRQETGCGHAPKGSLFPHQGRPCWGS